jgi:PAS domain S-box-containing protein
VDYQLILDNAPLPILIIQDGRIVFCNAAGIEVFRYCGYSTDASTIGDFDVWQLIGPEERERGLRDLEQLLRGGSPIHNNPWTLHDADGNRVSALVSAAPITWEGRPAVEISYVILGLYPVQKDSGDHLAATPRRKFRDARQSTLRRLTPQEARVAVRVAEGHTIPEIMAELAIRESTVRGYIKSIYRKLGVHSRSDLIRLLVGHG